MKSKRGPKSNQSSTPEVPRSEGDPVQNAPSPDQIEQRAYEIHIERGSGHGQDLDDWLQAERELEEKHRNG